MPKLPILSRSQKRQSRREFLEQLMLKPLSVYNLAIICEKNIKKFS